jgi:1-acyl-sn-glycerol-3-phosphate acyltransferase
MRIFPVTEAAPMAAVDLAVEALGQGDVVVWFGEGYRSADGRMLPFGPGIGRVIERSGAAAVPVLIDGTFEAWPRDRALPRPVPVRVVFGEPVAARDLLAAAAEGRGRPAAIASAIRKRIVALAAARGREIG